MLDNLRSTREEELPRVALKSSELGKEPLSLRHYDGAGFASERVAGGLCPQANIKDNRHLGVHGQRRNFHGTRFLRVWIFMESV